MEQWFQNKQAVILTKKTFANRHKGDGIPKTSKICHNIKDIKKVKSSEKHTHW